MHFCNKCDNMYYININDETNNIYYYCKKCGNINTTIINSNNIIYEHEITKSNDYKINNSINKYTKFDPTLPSINNIPCPNVNCPSIKDGKENRILFIKYDEDNIKFLYLCANCDHSWQN